MNLPDAALSRAPSRFDGTVLRAAPVLRARSMPRTRPVLGLMLVLIGTPIAAALVPQDFQEPQAVFLSGLIMTICLLLVPALCALRNLLSVARAEHLLMLGIVYWLLLDLLQGEYPLVGVSREGVQSALVGVGLFAAGIWIAALFRPWKLPAAIRKAAATQLRTDVLFLALLVCFALGFLRFAWPCGFNVVEMADALKGNRWSMPWSRGDIGGWDAILDHFAYFGYLVPAFTVMVAQDSRRKMNAKVMCGIALSIVMVVLLASDGGRRIIGVVCGSALLAWFLFQWDRVRLLTIVTAVFASIALIVALQTMLEYRGIGYGDVFSSEITTQSGYVIRVDDNILRVGQVMDVIPMEHDFVYGQYLLWVAARPIPRVLWQGKPLDPGFQLAQVVGVRGASLSTTIIGEAYMAFGWLGILVAGFIYGRLAGSYNLLLGLNESPTRILLYSFGVLSLFAGLRSGIELVLMSYTIIALIVVFALLRATSVDEQAFKIHHG